ncbi:DoxX family protein [Stackebrandtia soli]|uniref:DoxX family protein n=1 Tax=Stackebrandtia soli TaxID=1892856 RepID=UPI0039E9D518
MKIVLWVGQVALALFFGSAGFTKLTQPVDSLRETMGWIDSFPVWFVPVLGGLELLAAIGLILPAAFGILDILTPLAAVGLVVVMVGATITHAVRAEWPGAAMTIVLTVAAALIAWGRFRLRAATESTAEGEPAPA